MPQDFADREARQSFVQQLQDQEALQHWGKSPAWLHIALPCYKMSGPCHGDLGPRQWVCWRGDLEGGVAGGVGGGVLEGWVGGGPCARSI